MFSEDYETIPVTGQVPRGAELAVRIQGDSMEPHIHDGGVVYVNHDPLQNGDVGIFCVDGEMVCKQYYRDPLGMVYLFSLNRRRADADVLLPPAAAAVSPASGAACCTVCLCLNNFWLICQFPSIIFDFLHKSSYNENALRHEGRFSDKRWGRL